MSLRFLFSMLTINFFLGASIRESSFPYISGDSFRAIADHIFDEFQEFNPALVKNNDIIFVKSDYMERYFQFVHPLIPARYIIITHNSDDPAPGKYESYLNDEKIIYWFGQNPTLMNHPKFIPIPIGLANRCWNHGKIETFNRVICFLRINAGEKKYLLGINFRVNTAPHDREAVFNFFIAQSYCTNLYADNHETYLINMASAKFIVNPRGNGLDCHRLWEALLVGTIPILIHSTLDELLKDLPVLIVNDWSEITEEFLNQKYKEINDNCALYNYEKIYFSYWANVIKEYQQKNAGSSCE